MKKLFLKRWPWLLVTGIPLLAILIIGYLRRRNSDS